MAEKARAMFDGETPVRTMDVAERLGRNYGTVKTHLHGPENSDCWFKCLARVGWCRRTSDPDGLRFKPIGIVRNKLTFGLTRFSKRGVGNLRRVVLRLWPSPKSISQKNCFGFRHLDVTFGMSTDSKAFVFFALIIS
ncbi:MAG: hypothetical protein WBD31_27280 [Rubripirellula sp.]